MPSANTEIARILAEKWTFFSFTLNSLRIINLIQINIAVLMFDYIFCMQTRRSRRTRLVIVWLLFSADLGSRSMICEYTQPKISPTQMLLSVISDVLFSVIFSQDVHDNAAAS